jgi:hypothetical protein
VFLFPASWVPSKHYTAAPAPDARERPVQWRLTMRLKVIACEILFRELSAAAARSVNQIDIEFLPKGLHDLGSATMRGRLQAAVNALDESKYEAIALGYGLCGTGLAGLEARGRPLALPRAHDCITLFLGAKERYAEYFRTHPGVYFQTSGWIERGQELRQSGLGYSFPELAAKYGEENARYLWDEITKNYRQFTYIEMGVEPDDRFERHAHHEAAQRGWEFEKLAGDMRLLERLVNGEWDESEFLVVPPGWRIVQRMDESVVAAERTEAAPPAYLKKEADTC